MSTTNNLGCLGLIAALFGIKPKTQSGTEPFQLGDDFLSPADQGQLETENLPYRLRDDFLSPAEISFYHVVQSTVGEGFTICPKVNLADILFVSRPNENQAARSRIDRKHVDFLVCDKKTMQPLLAIELDDASHGRKDRQDRDAFVETVFEAAGLTLLRFPVQHAYTVADLSAKLSAALGAAPEPLLVPTGAPNTAESAPMCPKCGIPLVLRDSKRGQFFGCSNFPRCRQTVPVP